MDSNNIGDEMYEIKPDKTNSVEDSDMTISESEAVVEGASANDEPDGKAVENGCVESDFVESDFVEADPIKEESETPMSGSFESDFSESDFSDDDFKEEEFDDSEIFSAIGDSLSKQVENDLGRGYQLQDTEKVRRQSAFSRFIKRVPWWGYSLLVIVLLAIAVPLWLNFTDFGKAVKIKLGSSYIAEKVDYRPVIEPDAENDPAKDEELNPVKKVDEDKKGETEVQEDDKPKIPELVLDDTKLATVTTLELPSGLPKVYNVLIICEENLEKKTRRGSADGVLTASFNIETGEVSLVSFPKNMLIAVEDSEPIMLSSAYTLGGVYQMYDAFRDNFLLEFDNYVIVRFDGFEKLIDMLGGVDIELSKSEAKYLNTTNYISDEASRTLVKGINHMNGAQALGYCRISKVTAGNGEKGEFGRNYRMRNVLSSLYDSLMKLDALSLIDVMNTCLPQITTDITEEQLVTYITLLSSDVAPVVNSTRLPVSGSFDEMILDGEKLISFDTDRNVRTLIRFIYGDCEL